jgi:hypothetical protein
MPGSPTGPPPTPLGTNVSPPTIHSSSSAFTGVDPYVQQCRARLQFAGQRAKLLHEKEQRAITSGASAVAGVTMDEARGFVAELQPMCTREFIAVSGRHAHAVIRLLKLGTKWLAGSVPDLIGVLQLAMSTVGFYPASVSAELVDAFAALVAFTTDAIALYDPACAGNIISQLQRFIGFLHMRMSHSDEVIENFVCDLIIASDAAPNRLEVVLRSSTEFRVASIAMMAVIKSCLANSEIFGYPDQTFFASLCGMADATLRLHATPGEDHMSSVLTPALSQLAECLNRLPKADWYDSSDVYSVTRLGLTLVRLVITCFEMFSKQSTGNFTQPYFGVVDLAVSCLSALGLETVPDASAIVTPLISTSECVRLLVTLRDALDVSHVFSGVVNAGRVANCVKRAVLVLARHDGVRELAMRGDDAINVLSTHGVQVAQVFSPRICQWLVHPCPNVDEFGPLLRDMFASLPENARTRISENIVKHFQDPDDSDKSARDFVHAAGIIISLGFSFPEPADAVHKLAVHFANSRTPLETFLPLLQCLQRNPTFPLASMLLGNESDASAWLSVLSQALHQHPPIPAAVSLLEHLVDAASTNSSLMSPLESLVGRLVDEATTLLQQVSPACATRAGALMDMAHRYRDAVALAPHTESLAKSLSAFHGVLGNLRLSGEVEKDNVQVRLLCTVLEARGSQPQPKTDAVCASDLDTVSNALSPPPGSKTRPKPAPKRKRSTPAKRGRGTSVNAPGGDDDDDDVQIVDPPPSAGTQTAAATAQLSHTSNARSFAAQRQAVYHRYLELLIGFLSSQQGIASSDVLEPLLRAIRSPKISAEVIAQTPPGPTRRQIADFVVSAMANTSLPEPLRCLAASALANLANQFQTGAAFDESGRLVDPIRGVTLPISFAGILQGNEACLCDVNAMLNCGDSSAPAVLATLLVELHAIHPFSQRTRSQILAALVVQATSSSPAVRTPALAAIQGLGMMLRVPWKGLLSNLGALLAQVVARSDHAVMLILEDLAEITKGEIFMQLDSVICAWLVRLRDHRAVIQLNQLVTAAAMDPQAVAKQSSFDVKRLSGPRLALAVSFLLLDCPATIYPEDRNRLESGFAFIAESLLGATDVSLGAIISPMFRYIAANFIASFCEQHVPTDDSEAVAQHFVVAVGIARLASVLTSAKTPAQVVNAMIDNCISTRGPNDFGLAPHAFGILDVFCLGLGVTFDAEGALAENAGGPRSSEGPGSSGSATTTISSDPRVWLAAVTHLLLLLGPRVNVIARKIPPLLAACLSNPALQTAVELAWLIFVKQALPRDIEEVASSLAVDIITAEDKILSGQKLTNGAEKPSTRLLSRALHVLHSHTPRMAFWEPISNALRSSAAVQFVFPKRSVQPPTEVKLSGFIQGLKSSASTCRVVFAKSLLEQLSTFDNKALHHACHQSESTELATLLLQNSQEGEPLRSTCLRCLSLLGAQRVGFSGASAQFSFDVHMMLHWQPLVSRILADYCATALASTSDGRMHDRAAFAVQRLLRISVNFERAGHHRSELAEMQNVDLNELEGYSWWADLPSGTKATLSAFTSTRFETKVIFRTERQVPEYKPGLSFVRWLQQFFTNYVSRTVGTNGQIFDAVRNVAKRSVHFCQFLLPLVCANVVVSAEDAAAADLTTEIRTVLDHAQAAVEHVHTIFFILDALKRMVEEISRAERASAGTRETPKDDAERSRRIHSVTRLRAFLDGFSAIERSAAALSVNSASRALMYLESSNLLPDCSGRQDTQLIFAILDDTDASKCFHAAVAARGDWAATALSHEQCGEYAMALQCCEQYLQLQPDDRNVQNCALRCMKQLGMFNMMAQAAAAGRAASVTEKPSVRSESRRRSRSREGHQLSTLDKLSQALQATDVESSINNGLFDVQVHAAEAAWRLSRWDHLEAADAPPVARRGLPGALVHLRHIIKHENEETAFTSHQQAFQQLLDNERLRVASRISGSLKEGYNQAMPTLVALHGFGDLELVVRAVTDPTSIGITAPRGASPSQFYAPLVDLLNARLDMVEPTPKSMEVLLALHRAIFNLLDLPHVVAERWLRHADVLRDAGLLEPALTCVHHASSTLFANGTATSGPRVDGEQSVVARYYVTLARILHEAGRTTDAIDFATRNCASVTVPQTVRARLLVMATEWGLQVGTWSPSDAVRRFRDAADLHAFEGAFHALAFYLDKLYDTTQTDIASRSDKSTDVKEKETLDAIEQYVPSIIENYGKALKSGRERAYLSLPRLLTCWLDSTKTIAEFHTSAVKSRALAVNARLNAKVEAALLGHDSASPALTITALPQLISRLGHANFDVVNVITQVLFRLLTAFPQQTLWSLLAVLNSASGRTRMEFVRQQVIKPYTDLVKHDVKATQVVNTLQALFKSLIELCQASSTTIAAQRLTSLPYIKRVADLLPGAHVIMPIEQTLTPISEASPQDLATVFPTAPTFLRFNNEIEIMSSLQKPKKIGAYSECGRIVSFLCKSKDEPRKDMRLMELAALVNDVLRDASEARRRLLRLRRYAVTALTDDCALIEWVDNLMPIRKVCDDLYQLHGQGLRTSAIKALKEKCDKGQFTQLQLLKEQILPFFPPLLHQWLQFQFPHPAMWYEARNRFTRSVACWSMIGHIVGLGDRHGENLLLDLKTGEIAHCDFACMFDKGENLEVPERVRFRLTQNLVDGFGVTGVDGSFRKACELVLGTAEKHKASIVGLLETFLHDPLVEWITKPGSSSRSANPRNLIGRAARRLDGYLDLFGEPRDTVALSTEGQVLKLVHNARSLENLSRMYIWWMPWI